MISYQDFKSDMPSELVILLLQICYTYIFQVLVLWTECLCHSPPNSYAKALTLNVIVSRDGAYER